MEESDFPNNSEMSIIQLCEALQKSGADFAEIEGYGYVQLSLYKMAVVKNVWYADQMVKYKRDLARHEENMSSYNLKMEDHEKQMEAYEKDLAAYEAEQDTRDRAEKLAQLAQLTKVLGLPMPTAT